MSVYLYEELLLQWLHCCGGGGCLELNNGCELHSWGEGRVKHVPITESQDKLTKTRRETASLPYSHIGFVIKTSPIAGKSPSLNSDLALHDLD